MSDPIEIRLFLKPFQRRQLDRGALPFFTKMIDLMTEAGHQVDLHEATEAALTQALEEPGYDLVLNGEPMHPKALSVRQCYAEPFWRIEASERRWEFDVAHAAFDPRDVPGHRIPPFLRYWGNRFGHTQAPSKDGFVYVPLQGKLLTARSFQSMSPMQMLATLRQRTKLNIAVTLHPSEDYTDAERDAVLEMCKDPQVSLVDEPMSSLLPRCNYVVTQNSSVALHGFFYRKPAVLFGEVDFHHIAGSVPRDGMAKAFATLEAPEPEYGAYLFWFFQMQALNHWRPEFPQRLFNRLRDHGWPV